MNMEFRQIAHIENAFDSKFGVPRQAGLVQELEAEIVFEPEFRNPDALRGLEGFSHIWLIWEFSEARRDSWSPTVRPPRLGGNTRLGVFATRSPFRPNPIGLSAVRLTGLRKDPEKGTVLRVAGADLMNGTPILDIKPYLSYADSYPDAAGGFTDTAGGLLVQVDFPEDLLEKVPASLRPQLVGVLSHDPRPTYQHDPERVYGMSFGGCNIRFRVADGVLTVISAEHTGNW